MKLKKIVSRFTFQFDCKSDNYNNNNWQKNFTNVLFILYHYYCFIKGHCDVRICIYAKTLKCLTTQFLRVWFTDRIVPVENCTRHSFIWQSLFIDLWQVVGFHQSYSPTIIVKPRYYLKWKGSLVMVNNSTNNKTNNYISTRTIEPNNLYRFAFKQKSNLQFNWSQITDILWHYKVKSLTFVHMTPQG